MFLYTYHTKKGMNKPDTILSTFKQNGIQTACLIDPKGNGIFEFLVACHKHNMNACFSVPFSSYLEGSQMKKDLLFMTNDLVALNQIYSFIKEKENDYISYVSQEDLHMLRASSVFVFEVKSHYLFELFGTRILPYQPFIHELFSRKIQSISFIENIGKNAIILLDQFSHHFDLLEKHCDSLIENCLFQYALSTIEKQRLEYEIRFLKQNHVYHLFYLFYLLYKKDIMAEKSDVFSCFFLSYLLGVQPNKPNLLDPFSIHLLKKKLFIRENRKDDFLKVLHSEFLIKQPFVSKKHSEQTALHHAYHLLNMDCETTRHYIQQYHTFGQFFQKARTLLLVNNSEAFWSIAHFLHNQLCYQSYEMNQSYYLFPKNFPLSQLGYGVYFQYFYKKGTFISYEYV